MKRLLIALILIFTLPSGAWATYSLPSDRSVTWTGNIGISGGIPTRDNVLNCVDDTYDGKGTFYMDLVNDDKPAIAACVSALAENQVAYLKTGNYRLNSSLPLHSDMVLRGDGRTATKLYFYGGSGYGYITISASGTYDPAGVTITSGATKGSQTITVSSASGMSVGQCIAIDELDDNSTEAWSAGASGTQFSRDSNTRHRHQANRITGIDGTSISLEVPLYKTFSATPECYTWTPIHNVGIEDLYLDPSNASALDNTIYIQYAADVWVSGVEGYYSDRAHFRTFRVFRPELRNSYFHHSRAYASQGYGDELWYTSAALVENNAWTIMSTPLLNAAGCSGNVTAYNYIDEIRYDAGAYWLSENISIHASHGFANLFEGNIVKSIYWDNIWGSNSHNVAFRNRVFGVQTGRTQNTYPIVIEAHGRNNTVIGNVLGTDGYHDTYEAYGEAYSGTTAIWVLGYWGTSHAYPTNYDDQVRATLLRHGNYDFASDSQIFCDDVGEIGCQGGSTDHTLPDSFYLTGKPDWFGDLTYPPVNPTTGTASTIPAEQFFNTGNWPTAAGTGAPKARWDPGNAAKLDGANKARWQ